MAQRVGFIGVGRMGAKMANNLSDASVSLVAYDIDPERIALMEESGIDTATSIPSLVSDVDVVFTSLPRAEAVTEAFLGEDGVLSAATDGQLFVELSTVRPETVESIERAIEERGLDIDFVDAPVIGIPSTAAAAELTILAGGTTTAFERVEPLLAHLGTKVVHVGDVGEAKAFKLINNLLIFGNYAVAAEAFALAARMGIDQEDLFDITDSGAAQSTTVASKFPNVVAEDFEPGFTLEGAVKDLQYALDLGHAEEFQMPIAEIIASNYEFAAATEDADSDYSILMRTLEQY